jgi:outer membrane protein assembly factor BamA
VEAVWVFSDMLPTADPELHPRGKTLRLGVEYSDETLGSDLGYIAYEGEFRGYAKIAERGSIALRILAKRIENKQDFPRILFSLGSDPYYLGWDSLRGYPRDFGVVGENLLLSSLEYRCLLARRIGGFSTLYLDRLGAALFFDIGDVFSDEEDLELRRDLGLELRLRTLLFGKAPLILRLGIAWPLDEEEREGRLFFATGEAF